MQLKEFTQQGVLNPTYFNGTWISDTEILFQESNVAISVLNLETSTKYQVGH